MKTSRLKEIVIVLLALLDLCLGVLLASRLAQDRAARERTVAQLVRLFEAGGITLPPSLVPEERPELSALEPVRDLEAEASFAAELLGPCVREDVGGGIYRYVSESGQCLFRSGGTAEASLRRETEKPEDFCSALFSRFGYALLRSDLSAGGGSVTAVRTPEDACVFNAELTLTFADGCLTAAAGSFVPPFEPVRGGGGLDGVTALVRFLDHSRGSGDVSTGITGVRGGYVLQSTATVPQRLVPAWCITTDVNQYYVNMETGEVTRGD